MRPIDADALIHELNTRKVPYRRDVEKCIEDAPTITAKVAYVCDGRACDGDCRECFRTTDISHAKHFELVGDAYIEKRKARECEDCGLADLAEAFAHDYVKVAVDKALELMTWRPADISTPYEIGAEHVLVTIKWAEDDFEVCEMDPMVMKKYNVIAWMPLPAPYKGEAK